MVQMGDSVAVERCVQHLNNIPFGKEGKLQIAFSKQNFLSEVTNPFNLPDHTPSFREYTGSKNNRFLSPAQASKNRIQPPSKVCWLKNVLCFFYWTNIFIFFVDSSLFQHTTRYDWWTIADRNDPQRLYTGLNSYVPHENRSIIVRPDRVR